MLLIFQHDSSQVRCLDIRHSWVNQNQFPMKFGIVTKNIVFYQLASWSLGYQNSVFFFFFFNFLYFGFLSVRAVQTTEQSQYTESDIETRERDHSTQINSEGSCQSASEDWLHPSHWAHRIPWNLLVTLQLFPFFFPLKLDRFVFFYCY